MSRRSWLPGLCVLSVLAAAPAGAALPHLPTAPLRAAFAAQRAGGAERSETLARALLVTAAHSPVERRPALLELATQLDPTLAEPHLERARLALCHGDVADAGAALARAWEAVRTDARQQALWLHRAFHAAHLLLAATLLTLGALLVLRSLPLARHAAGERLGSDGAATILLLAPILAAVLLSPSLGLLLLIAALATFMPRGERTSLALLCIGLAALDVALPRFVPHAMLLDPRTQIAQVARANDAAADAALVRRLTPRGSPSADVEIVLGMQARRRGDVETARGHYIACLRADSTCAAAYVNLANLFFRAGQYERAAAGYRAAQALDPSEPLPYADLAQTYIRMTHYEESDQELRAAAEHGFGDVSRRRGAWRDESFPVLDMTIAAPRLLQMARREAAARPEHARELLQTWQSAAWRGVRPDLAPWLLLGAAVLLLSRWRWRALAMPCPECGALRCAVCAASEGAEETCPACQPARPRPSSRGDDVPSAEEVEPARRRPAHPRAFEGRWLAGLFPGAADVLLGAPFAALVAALVGWSALLAGATAIEAARSHAVPWYVGVDAGLLRGAALVFACAYLPGLVALRRRERLTRATVGPAAWRRQPQEA